MKSFWVALSFLLLACLAAGQAVTYQITSTPTFLPTVGRAEILGTVRLTAVVTLPAPTATVITILYQSTGCDNGPGATGIVLATQGSGMAAASIAGVANSLIGCSVSISIPSVAISAGDYFQVGGVRGRIDLSPASAPSVDINAGVGATPLGSALFLAPAVARVGTSLPARSVTVASQAYSTCGTPAADPAVTVTELFHAAFVHHVTTSQGTLLPYNSRAPNGQANNNTQVRIVVSGLPAGVTLTWPAFVNASGFIEGFGGVAFPRTGGAATVFVAGSVDVSARLERITPATATSQVYEFASANQASSDIRIESFAITPTVSYTAPAVGAATVQVQLAPELMTVGEATSVSSAVAAASAPRPRFNDPLSPATPFVTIAACNPAPAISFLTPSSTPAGGPSFILTVNGSDFVSGSVVRWNGSARSTTYVNASQVTAAIFAGDITTPGAASVTVFNPPPAGGESTAAAFSITTPCTYTLSATSASFGPTAGSGSVTATTTAGCAWTATSESAFLTVTSGASGSGSGAVDYSVAANLTSATRVGALTIAGQTFTVTQLGRVDGTVSAVAALGAPGATTRVPVTLALTAGVSIDSVTFGLTVAASGGSPALTGSLGFAQDAAMPAPDLVDTALSPGSIAVSWLNLAAARTGTVTLGEVLVPIPASAVEGQAYTVHISAADAALGTSPAPLLAGADALVTISSYSVGDVFPFSSDSFPNFGDSILNTVDLIHTLRAVTSLPGFRPPACTDRFDAMDTAPADTASVRGGDGALTTLDLIVSLRRVVSLDASRPRRASRGLACPTVMERATGDEEGRSDAAGFVQLGDVEDRGVPVYLHASEELLLSGLALGIGSATDSRLAFRPGTAPAPSLVDHGVAGSLAVAWLEGLLVRAGERLLLGYIDGARPPLRILRISATTMDGREVSIGKARWQLVLQ